MKFRSALKEKRKEKNKRPRVKKIFFLIGLLIALIILIKNLSSFRSLQYPLDDIRLNKDINFSLNYNSRVNIVLITGVKSIDDLLVFSYNPRDKQSLILNFDLNSSEKRTLNEKFEREGIEEVLDYFRVYLSVPIDRYIFINTKTEFIHSDLINIKKSFKNEISAAFFLFENRSYLSKNVYSDLSINEAWYLIRAFGRSTIDIENSLGLDNKNKGIESIREARLKNIVRAKFADHLILKEGALVSIKNASGKSGLGENLSLILKNLGATVISVDYSDSSIEKSHVIVKNNRKNFLKRLKSIIFYKLEEKEEKFLGDILIVLGKDNIDRLTFE